MSQWNVASNLTGNLPPIGQAVLGYSPAWVDEDFCPDGIRECFLFGDGTEWQSAEWDGYWDKWVTKDSAPTHWQAHPAPPGLRI